MKKMEAAVKEFPRCPLKTVFYCLEMENVIILNTAVISNHIFPAVMVLQFAQPHKDL